MIILPVYHWFLPPFMILWGVFWLVEVSTGTRDAQKVTLHQKMLFILFILFFAWQVFGMLYSDNPQDGWRNITLRLSLVFFPIVLISPGYKIRLKVTTLLQLFALSTLFISMVCFGYAFYRSFNFQNWILTFDPQVPVDDTMDYFHAIPFAIFQHPSYLSMYVLFSVFIAFESLSDRLVLKYQRYFWFAVSIILLVSIYFLSSRAVILATIILIPIYVFLKLRILRINKYLGMSILVGVILLLPIYLTNPRINKYLKCRTGEELSDMTLEEPRINIWNAVNPIIKRNILFGTGIGDIQDELNKEYIKTGNTKLSTRKVNAHNQYLEIVLENGLIGLFLFLSLFGMMLYISISEGNLLYLMFLLIVIISFLFETMLNRLAGGSFFALFSFLLIHINKNIQKNSDQPQIACEMLNKNPG